MSLLLSALAAGAVAKSAAGTMAYSWFRHGRAGYHMVVADLSSGRVQARTVHIDGLASPWGLIGMAQPAAAITGTFFAPGVGTPVADVLVDGELVARGNRGTAVAVDYFGRVHILDKPYLRRLDWEGYRFGLRGGVRLVTKGRVNPNPRAQRFRDPRIWGRAARTGVGVTKAGKLVMMATSSNVTLSEFGRAMVSRGVRDAVNLDGGGSTLLYYRGDMKVRTSRYLSNLFVLTDM